MSGVQVVKIGGAALTDTQWLERFAAHARDGRTRIIVHGGGPEVSALSERLGIEVRWRDGRRVTTPEALDVAAMVLSGRINKRIVRALRVVDVPALGLSGEDGVVEGELAQEGQLGRVGAVVQVDAALLKQLIGAGLVPVISPISADRAGDSLNINADEVATAIAAAVGADELLFLTDVAAVRNETGNCTRLDGDAALDLVERGVASGGMAVKLRAAVGALRARVERVRVGGLEMMNNPTAGTLLSSQVA